MKAVLIAAALLLTGCGMKEKIEESTMAIHCNRQVVEASTAKIRENRALIDESTKALQENKRALDNMK